MCKKYSVATLSIFKNLQVRLDADFNKYITSSVCSKVKILYFLSLGVEALFAL